MLNFQLIKKYLTKTTSLSFVGVLFLVSLGFSQDDQAEISYSNITEGSVSIDYNSDVPIYGFQFNVFGVTLTDVSSTFDLVSFNASNGIVLGSSLSGINLPAGEGSLAVLVFSSSF